VNPQLLASIKQHEGCPLKAYQDSEGVWTIGYGRNLQELEITKEQAELWLIDDIKKAIYELDRAFKGWREHSEVRQNVLIEMMYQLGAPRLAGFLRFWNALRSKDYKTAAREMLDSRWAKQTPLRVMTLAARMETDSF
jgi:lysozyme